MMHSSFFLSDALVRALGWTLVHALWQGAAIALILWILLPRLHSARLRYRAAYCALLSLAPAAAVTFWLVYEPLSTTKPAAGQGLPVTGTTWSMAASALSPDFWTRAIGNLEACYPMIVAVWLAGLLFFLLRLAAGLHYVHRLRRQTSPVRIFWQENLQQLATQIGYAKPVLLLESALIRAPMTLGFFKPLILFPIGMTNHLAPSEVEAVLAHELAHLARHDWVFNLLQTLLEAVFYFHPAVWWMSATIRTERENCCDDTAVALTGNRLAYAKTLARLQDIARTSATPALALGLDGAPTLLRRRPLLLERIKRILHQPQPSSTAMEKAIALAVLTALVTLWTLQANTPPALVNALREISETPKAWFSAPVAPEKQAWQAAADTVPTPTKERRRIVHEDGDQRVELEMDGNKISRLVVDGKEIAAADYGQYSELTEEILSDVPPTPPIPPTPPSWGTMPAPPDAPRAWMMPTPRAPIAPRALNSTISTEVDDAGNTIIRLEQNGKPVEIQVKADEVWIDGKKLEKGEKIELPGIHFLSEGEPALYFDGHQLFAPQPDGGHWKFEMPTPPDAPDAPQFFHVYPDDNSFFFHTPDGNDLIVKERQRSKSDAQKAKSEALRELEQHRRQLEQELRHQQNDNRKELSKAQREERKAMEEAYRALEKAERARQDAMRQLMNEQRKAQAEQGRAREQQLRMYRNHESTSDFLKSALLRDKLIGDPDNFSLELSGKNMKVDGKKQPNDVHQKYLELYQKKTGNPLGKKDEVRIEVAN